MEKNCSNCKSGKDVDNICFICNSDLDMWRLRSYETLDNVDKKDIENLLFCVNESITGIDWRIENEPETIDKIDYEKYDEWTAVLRQFPREYWTDNMKNE